MPGTQVVDVLLLDLPVALWADTAERAEALLAALAPRAGDDPAGAPARLLAATAALAGDYANISAPSELELRAAAARRIRQIDVAYGVPRSARDAVAAVAAAYDAADDYCRAHGLAHLAAPPSAAAFRRWFYGQIVEQLDGGFPTPWRD